MGGPIRYSRSPSPGIGVNFRETNVEGAHIIEPELVEDERGFFANVFSREEFMKRGLNPEIVQSSTSYNRSKGTLRGLHYQMAPHEEAKVVRCTRGRIFDVVVDLRAGSKTYRRWSGEELSESNRYGFYVPEMCAHGFITLEDDSEVAYMLSSAYASDSARGVRWNDPGLDIDWPHEPRIIAERDASYPDFDW